MSQDNKYVVIMFEPARNGEKLTLGEQVNEVFGPFDTADEAEAWTNRALDLIKYRQWLMIPLSPSSNLNSVDPTIN